MRVLESFVTSAIAVAALASCGSKVAPKNHPQAPRTQPNNVRPPQTNTTLNPSNQGNKGPIAADSSGQEKLKFSGFLGALPTNMMPGSGLLAAASSGISKLLRQQVEISQVPPAEFHLRFVGDVLTPRDAQANGKPVGELSSLIWDAEKQRFLALSDDRKLDSSRIFSFKVNFAGKPGAVPSIEPESVIMLTSSDGKTSKKLALDTEGLAPDGNGGFVISTEGDVKSPTRVAPEVLQFSASGELRSRWTVPSHFIPEQTGEQKKGVRHNLGFESLTKVPGKDVWYVATESGLFQDDSPANFSRGSNARLVRYERESAGQSAKPVAEFVVQVHPIPPALHPPARTLSEIGARTTGIVDMVALNETKLLLLERSAQEVKGVYQNQVRLFAVDLAGARNVAGFTSLNDPSLALQSEDLAKKSLVLDFNEVIPHLSAEYKRLDNLEGLAFGPTLPNGNRSLFVVSDDNFSATQRTQWLVFEVVPGPKR